MVVSIGLFLGLLCSLVQWSMFRLCLPPWYMSSLPIAALTRAYVDGLHLEHIPLYRKELN